MRLVREVHWKNLSILVDWEKIKTGWWALVNPLTQANKKFADFRENFTAYCPRYGEFKTVGIFAISLSVPKIQNIFDFLDFLTVYAYLKFYSYENYTAKSTF